MTIVTQRIETDFNLETLSTPYGDVRYIRDGKDILFDGNDAARAYGFKPPYDAYKWCKGGEHRVLEERLGGICQRAVSEVFIPWSDLCMLEKHSLRGKDMSAHFSRCIYNELISGEKVKPMPRHDAKTEKKGPTNVIVKVTVKNFDLESTGTPFGSIRYVLDDGNIQLVGKDAAFAFGYSNP